MQGELTPKQAHDIAVQDADCILHYLVNAHFINAYMTSDQRRVIRDIIAGIIYRNFFNIPQVYGRTIQDELST